MSGVVLLSPRIRLGRFKLANKLLEEELSPEVLQLPYPKELERVLNLYVKGVLGVHRVFEYVREVLGEFASSWLWIEEPLILSLPRIGVKRILCYLRDAADAIANASQLVSLAFRVRVGGKINLEEWRKTLTDSYMETREGWVTVANSFKVAPRAVDTWGLPYPPPERLDPDNITEEDVREYVEYIFNYIVNSRNVDEAYLRWLNEKKGLQTPELWRLLRLISQ